MSYNVIFKEDKTWDSCLVLSFWMRISLCSPDWPGTHGSSSCLSLRNAEVTKLSHHSWSRQTFLKKLMLTNFKVQIIFLIELITKEKTFFYICVETWLLKQYNNRGWWYKPVIHTKESKKRKFWVPDQPGLYRCNQIIILTSFINPKT